MEPGTQPPVVPYGSPFAPGGSFKLLRGGTHSANFVAIPETGAYGQCSYNFFKQSWVTHVAAPDNAILKDKFSTSSPVVDMVGLKDFASSDEKGAVESVPKFPFMLTIAMHETVKDRFPDVGPRCNADLWAQLCSFWS